MIGLVAWCWIVSVVAVAWLFYHLGHHDGLRERKRTMTLRRRDLTDTNRRIDDDTLYERHSAIHPKQGLWH